MFAVCHWTLSIISLITERQLRPWTTSERSCFDVPDMETYQSSVGIVEHRELLLAQTNINRRNHRAVESRTFIGIQLRRQDGSEKNVFNDRTRWTERAAEVQIENWNLWARDPCWVGVWCCNRFPLNHRRLLSYWIYGSFGVVQLSAVRNDVESEQFMLQVLNFIAKNNFFYDNNWNSCNIWNSILNLHWQRSFTKTKCATAQKAHWRTDRIAQSAEAAQQATQEHSSDCAFETRQFPWRQTTSPSPIGRRWESL